MTQRMQSLATGSMVIPSTEVQKSLQWLFIAFQVKFKLRLSFKSLHNLVIFPALSHVIPLHILSSLQNVSWTLYCTLTPLYFLSGCATLGIPFLLFSSYWTPTHPLEPISNATTSQKLSVIFHLSACSLSLLRFHSTLFWNSTVCLSCDDVYQICWWLFLLLDYKLFEDRHLA